MRTLKFHIKNQINQREFKISVALLYALVILAFLQACMVNYKFPYVMVRNSAENSLIIGISSRVAKMMFVPVIPLIATTMCAGCRKNSDLSGNGLFSLLRMNKRKYITGNAAAVVLITIITVFAALLINQVLCCIAFPMNYSSNSYGFARYRLLQTDYSNYLFWFWYVQNPYIYNIFYMIIISLLSGGFALLSYGLCMLPCTRKLKGAHVSVLSYGLIMVVSILGQVLKVKSINVFLFLEEGPIASLSDGIILLVILYAAGIFMTEIGAKYYGKI